MKKTIFYFILVSSLMFSPTLWAGQKLTLMLDWFPNVDHLPIYVAREMGYFSDNHIEVDIISPSETSDALKLAASGNMDLAVSYQPQTIIAADMGLPVKAVAPLVIHPLTTLLFLDGTDIQQPSDLSGKKNRVYRTRPHGCTPGGICRHQPDPGLYPGKCGVYHPAFPGIQKGGCGHGAL